MSVMNTKFLSTYKQTLKKNPTQLVLILRLTEKYNFNNNNNIWTVCNITVKFSSCINNWKTEIPGHNI